MARACSTNGDKRNAYRILVGKPERKRPLGKPRHRWVYNIKMNPRETGWDGMDSIDMAQDRDRWRAFLHTIMNIRVPKNAGDILSSCTTCGFSRRARLHECLIKNRADCS
jgi:hypothetical protein